MESLFETNPALNNALTKYIYGTDRSSYLLYLQLCSLRIPIQGFVDDSLKGDISFFHKKVYKTDRVNNESNSIIISAVKGNSSTPITMCESVAIVNPALGHKIAIYGAGVVGREVKKWFDKNGYKVECFIVSENSKESYIDGIIVRDRSYLNEINENISIVVAGRYWKEIECIIDSYKRKNQIFLIPNIAWLNVANKTESIVVDWDTGESMSAIHSLIYLEEHWADKSIMLYGGPKNVMDSYVLVYKLLGYDRVCVAENVSELKKKKDRIVFLYDYKKEQELKGVGLKEIEDYVSIQYPSIIYHREPILDINIGFAYINKNGFHGKPVCAGITAYGDCERAKYRIVALGNSTTEDGRNVFPSWPELLYSIFQENGMDCIVYNCGTAGYTSLQEFIRLLRDGVGLQPDYVLQLSGVVDILTEEKNDFGFLFPKLLHACEKVCDKEKGDLLETGIKSNLDIINKWLLYVKCTYAASKSIGSKYRCFIQPNFLSKKGKVSIHDRKLELMENAFYSKEVIRRANEFRGMGNQIEKENPFITDLSAIFDDMDVYLDASHVYECGNHILAQKIWEKIKLDLN